MRVEKKNLMKSETKSMEELKGEFLLIMNFFNNEFFRVIFIQVKFCMQQFVVV